MTFVGLCCAGILTIKLLSLSFYLVYKHALPNIQFLRDASINQHFVDECLEIESEFKSSVFQELVRDLVVTRSLPILEIVKLPLKLYEGVWAANILLELLGGKGGGVLLQDELHVMDGKVNLGGLLATGTEHRRSLTFKNSGKVVEYCSLYLGLLKNHLAS